MLFWDQLIVFEDCLKSSRSLSAHLSGVVKTVCGVLFGAEFKQVFLLSFHASRRVLGNLVQ